MKLGAIFPSTEIGTDPIAIRDYTQAIEEMGYDHLVLFDHVLGADPGKHELWGPYTHEFQFHEPFVLMGYLAAITRSIELATGIIIAPQRQTALLAKQAAEVDVLTGGGRLRLGLGIGWNQVEYQGLGQDFSTRGKRIEEQIALMKVLWSKNLVTFEGKWDTVIDAGINPLPVNKSIPIWMGGWADPMVRRIARLADGWFSFFQPDDAGKRTMEKFYTYVDEAGRNAKDIGIEAWVTVNNAKVLAGWKQRPEDKLERSPDEWCKEIRAWQDLGATHIGCWTMYAGYTPDQHIEAARRFKAVADSV